MHFRVVDVVAGSQRRRRNENLRWDVGTTCWSRGVTCAAQSFFNRALLFLYFSSAHCRKGLRNQTKLHYGPATPICECGVRSKTAARTVTSPVGPHEYCDSRSPEYPVQVVPDAPQQAQKKRSTTFVSAEEETNRAPWSDAVSEH